MKVGYPLAQAPDITRRTRVTRPYPTYTLEEALNVARTIYEVNAGLPFDRELLADALGTTPKSSAFTMRLNASAAYGLTEGGYNDPDIRLTNLGEAAVSSAGSPAHRRAIVQAAMNPDTFGRFYELYDGRKLPGNTYLHSMLDREFSVRKDIAEECLSVLKDNGRFAGIISETDGAYLVRLPATQESIEADSIAGKGVRTGRQAPYETGEELDARAPNTQDTDPPKAIFIGHIGDSVAANYVVSMLDEFGIGTTSPLISDDNDGLLVSKGVSKAMRESSAAVLVFRSSDNAWSSRDKMIGMLGAASVLFDDRIVMLQEDGARMSISSEGISHIEFDHERPGESGMNLLVALHKAGVINVSA